jgi:reactive intermediate/imine deaminase
MAVTTDKAGGRKTGGGRRGKAGGAQGSAKTCFGAPIVLAGAQRMPFSSAVRAGDFIFVSGVTAIDENGAFSLVGIEAQTRRVLDTIRTVLAETGCTLADVVKTTVWLDDPRDFWNFNRIYREYFPENPPARSCVRSSLMLDGKVEIEAIAYRPQD